MASRYRENDKPRKLYCTGWTCLLSNIPGISGTISLKCVKEYDVISRNRVSVSHLK